MLKIMKLKTAKILVLAALVLASGCATTPRGTSSVSPETDSSSGMAADTGASAPELSAQHAAANAEFDPHVLYQLLVAEVAAQRGKLGVAVVNYLAAARASRDSNIARRATQLAIFAQTLRQALEASQLWVELEPDSLEAYQIVAPLLLTFGRAPEAVEHFKRLIELSADKPDHGLMLIANQLSRERNHVAAMSVMDELVASREDDAYAWLARSQMALRQENLPQATDSVERALSLHAHWSPAVVLRARVFEAQGDKEAALSFLAHERKGVLSKDVTVGLNYARMLAEAGKLKEARKEFESLAKQQPRNADLHYAAGVLALQFKALDQAESRFKQVLKLGKRRQEATYHLARVYEAKGENAEAIHYYLAVQGNSFYFDAQMRVVNLLADEEDLDAAINHLRNVRVANEDQEIRLVLLEAELLRKAGKLREALAFFTEKLEQFPDNTSLRYARALLAENLDELDLAEQDLLHIINREPTNAQALNALGYTLADRTTRFDEALGYIERALVMEPEDAVIIDSLGWVQYRMGNLAKAVEHLRRAMALIDDPEVAAHLGEVLWMMGKKQDAMKIWEASLKDHPDHKTLLNILERFGP